MLNGWSLPFGRVAGRYIWMPHMAKPGSSAWRIEHEDRWIILVGIHCRSASGASESVNVRLQGLKAAARGTLQALK